MSDLFFRVSGSSENVYELSLVTREGVTAFLCTCDAGQNGAHCKHRLNLIAGDTAALLSENHSDVEVLAAIVKDGPIGQAIASVQLAEAEQAAAKRKVTKEKKRLAAALMGRKL